MFINNIEIRTNPAGMVLYMSDWFECDNFAQLGYFRSEFGGSFFYLTAKGRERSERQSHEPFVPFGAN